MASLPSDKSATILENDAMSSQIQRFQILFTRESLVTCSQCSQVWYKDYNQLLKVKSVRGKLLLFIYFNSFSYLHKSTNRSLWFYVWLTSKTVSTSYSIFWDIKMDFGFFAASDGGHKWLRGKLLYSSASTYYLIIVENVSLRFFWIIGFVNSQVQYYEVRFMIFKRSK